MGKETFGGEGIMFSWFHHVEGITVIIFLISIIIIIIIASSPVEVRRGGVFHQAVRKTREEMPGDINAKGPLKNGAGGDVRISVSNLCLQQGQ